MAATSELLKMHIGVIERWISQALMVDEDYQWLEAAGYCLKNGVILTHPGDSSFCVTPRTAAFKYVDLCPDRIGEVFAHYFSMLQKYDSAMIEFAADLDARIKDFEDARVREQLFVGGTVWWRNKWGIWELEVLAIIGGDLVYKDKNAPDSKGRRHMSQMELFASKEDALDSSKEGYIYGQ